MVISIMTIASLHIYLPQTPRFKSIYSNVAEGGLVTGRVKKKKKNNAKNHIFFFFLFGKLGMNLFD